LELAEYKDEVTKSKKYAERVEVNGEVAACKTYTRDADVYGKVTRLFGLSPRLVVSLSTSGLFKRVVLEADIQVSE
jgi:hypothetical protein